MKKLLKIASALILVFVLIVAGAGVYVLVNINVLAKRTIETQGTAALGVPTRVDSVSMRPFRGELAISGLDIANPPGFTSPHFLTLKDGNLAVTLGTIRQPVIDVPELHLSGIDVNLERRGNNANYKAIIDNIAKLKKGSTAAPNEQRLIIHSLRIDTIAVHIDGLGMPGPIGDIVKPLGQIDVPITVIQLTDVGRTGTGVRGTGVTTQELTNIIVEAVLNAVAKNGNGILPVEILKDLQGSLALLDNLADIPVQIINSAGDAADKAIKDVGKTIDEGLKGLIPGSDKKPDDKKKK